MANPEAPALGSEELDSRVQWEVVPGNTRSQLRALLSSEPVVGARFGIPAFARRIEDCLASSNYDAVVVDQHGMAWSLPLIQRIPAARRPAIVHIAHDFETEVSHSIAASYRGNPLRKLALHLNARRTAAAERRLAASAALIVTLTSKDRDLFRSIGAKRSFLVLPPGYDGLRRAERQLTAASPRRVAIVGSYSWTAKQINLATFLADADAIFAQAGIELCIVGSAPKAFQARFEGQLVASRFLGFVDDLGRFLDTCRLGLVVETIGGGFKLKVLDYVLTRTPVAALGPALDGQAPEVIEHFIIKPDAEALARAIVDAIDDIEQLNSMQNSAYQAAVPLYDWREKGRDLLHAIEALTQRAVE